MHPHFTRLFSLVALSTVFGILPSAQSVVTQQQQRINIDASTSLVGYMNSASVVFRSTTMKGQKQSTMLDIPMLDIYSPSGNLIYHGTSETKAQNLQILDQLPQSVAGLKPIADTPPLRPLLEILPETNTASTKILGDGHYVVYAISLLQDHPTTTQLAIQKLRERDSSLPVDAISVRLKQ